MHYIKQWAVYHLGPLELAKRHLNSAELQLSTHIFGGERLLKPWVITGTFNSLFTLN